MNDCEKNVKNATNLLFVFIVFILRNIGSLTRNYFYQTFNSMKIEEKAKYTMRV